MSRSDASFKSCRRWTEVEAREALAALRSSGLTAAAFARREGLDAQRLRAWDRRLETTSPTFIEVPRRTPELVEIVLPSGLLVRVAATIEPEALRGIVEAVEGIGRC
jgi:transposase-like protein